MNEQFRIDWLSAGQFMFSSLVIVFSLLVGGFGLAAVSLNEFITGVPLPASQITSTYLLLAGIMLMGILLIPSAYYSGKRLMGKPASSQHWLGSPLWTTVVAVGLITAVALVPEFSRQNDFLFMVIHALVNGFLVLWMISLVFWGLDRGSSQRFWGGLGSGLALSPLLALVLEIMILVLILGIWAAYLQTQPEVWQDISSLINRLPQTAVNPSILERTVGKYLAQPGVMGTILIFLAVLVPLVEELIKPIGVWLLLGRELSPLEGFLLGAAGGAGYALFENLTIGANAEVWNQILISRIGTTAVHMFTSGLVGWGLAWAWTRRKPLRLGSAYLAAVILHGVWNGFNVINLLTIVPHLESTVSPLIFYLIQYAPAGLVILGVGSFLGLLKANFSFRRAIIAQD